MPIHKKQFNKLFSLIACFLLFTFTFLLSSPAHAAANFSTSGGGNATVGQTITVSVSVNRNSAYNAVTVNVAFTNLTYVSASVQGGWTPVSGPSRSGNTISFSGALLGSSVTGSRQVLSVTFKAPGAPGTSTIKSSGIVDGSGLGTGSESGNGNTVTYSVKAAPTAPPATPTPKPAPGALTIGSSTHPDQNSWYKSTEAAFSWNKDNEVTDFSYILDNQTSTNPDDASEGGDNSKTFTGLTDGTNYFHIKAKNSVGWGPTAHFKINVDTKVPNPFTATMVTDAEGKRVLYFATSDGQSGIALYNLKLDGSDLGAKETGTIISNEIKEVEITAVDRAGNSITSKLTLAEPTASITTTTGTPSPTVTDTAEQTNSKNSSTSTLLLVGLLLAVLYGIVMTLLFLREKGYLAGLGSVLKPKSKTVITTTRKEEKLTNESPLK